MSQYCHVIVAELWPDFFTGFCFTLVMARPPQPAITDADLQQWKLLAPFQQGLEQVSTAQGLPRTWADPKRLLELSEYLGLFLFGLLNPVVQTMRGLCAASTLPRVQQQVCQRPVSLGSFSEAQHVVEPELLQAVFDQLRAQVPGHGGDPRLGQRPWQLVDSTLWAALPRMHWAVWRTQGTRQQAVRWHIGFHLLTDQPVQATLTAGRRCERAVWREHWQAGAAYVGDRYYGEDYRLLDELGHRGCHYVIRLRETAVIQVAEELPVSAADRAAGVVRQAWVRLGADGGHRRDRVRVVWVAKPAVALILVTNQTPAELSGELVALLYRYRWQVELFFRWIKCILGNRHWLAESQAGVTVQVYLALIAALLLQLYTGKRPRRRMMELIQWYLMGWASATDLAAAVQREVARQKKKV